MKHQEEIAMHLVDECLTWRKEVKVDQIAETFYERKEAFVSKWPHGLHGTPPPLPTSALLDENRIMKKIFHFARAFFFCPLF